MLKLGISTAASPVSLALVQDDKILLEHVWDTIHVDDFPVRIQSVLEQTGKTIADIDEIVVVNGPGSYSGIRAGISIAKTMALVRGVPVKAVQQVELLAFTLRHYKGLIVVLMEARKGELNTGLFGGNPFNILLKHEVTSMEQAYSKISLIEGEYSVVGDLKEVPPLFAARYTPAIGRASDAILLAAVREAVDVALLAPVYAFPVNIKEGTKTYS